MENRNPLQENEMEKVTGGENVILTDVSPANIVGSALGVTDPEKYEREIRKEQ